MDGCGTQLHNGLKQQENIAASADSDLSRRCYCIIFPHYQRCTRVSVAAHARSGHPPLLFHSYNLGQRAPQQALLTCLFWQLKIGMRPLQHPQTLELQICTGSWVFIWNFPSPPAIAVMQKRHFFRHFRLASAAHCLVQYRCKLR